MRADWLPGGTFEAARAFARRGSPLYAVGGTVRNALLGLPPGDVDLAAALPPEEAAAAFEEAGGRTAIKDKQLGTLDVRLSGGAAEYTPFRRESYTGGHRPSELSWTQSLEEDAFRRDFSVNALYLDLLTGDVLDPTNGLADVTARVMRATTPDPGVILRDDGVRLLRLCRLCAELGFTADARTLAAAKANAHLLTQIAPERREKELRRLLLTDKLYPRGDVRRGLELLSAVGLWDRLTGRAPENAWTDACCAVTSYPARLAALCGLRPDIKALTANLRLPRAVLAGIGKLSALAAEMPGLTDEDAPLLRLRADDGDIAEALALSESLGGLASARAAGLRATFAGCAAAPRALRELAVDGDTLIRELSLPPSPRVGEVLRALLAHAALHPEQNERGALLKLAREMEESS